MAVAKQYAFNSMENAHFSVNVTASEAVLQEIYLVHFRKCIKEGIAEIMSSYNSVNGEWAGQNENSWKRHCRINTALKGLWCLILFKNCEMHLFLFLRDLTSRSALRNKDAETYQPHLKSNAATWAPACDFVQWMQISFLRFRYQENRL
jgi:hypothetical protein